MHRITAHPFSFDYSFDISQEKYITAGTPILNIVPPEILIRLETLAGRPRSQCWTIIINPIGAAALEQICDNYPDLPILKHVTLLLYYPTVFLDCVISINWGF